MAATIKSKIEKRGIPLKYWDIQINRGILTGLNEAFIIGLEDRNRLIAQSSKNAEIIRPILRGKDIKKYQVNFANQWILFIPWHFPLQNDNSVKGASDLAEREFEIQYPDVFKYLLKYQDPLLKRNKAETGIRYEWYALQRFGANYWLDFEKPKITWGNLALHPQFAYTKENYIINAPSPFFASENMYLLAMLNSKVSEYYIKSLGVARNGGYIEFKPMFVEQMPIPRIPESEQETFSKLVKTIINRKNQGLDTSEFENEINDKVFQLYGLNEEEINFLVQC